MITVQPGRYDEGVTLTGNASLYQKESNNNIIACIEVDFGGQTLKSYQTLYTDKDGIKTKTIENLKAIFTEWGGDLGDLYDLLNAGGDKFRGRQVSATVGVNKKDDGKEYSCIDWLNPYGSGGGGEMPAPSDKKALLAKFGAQFRAIAGGKPAPKATTTAAATPPAAAPTPPKPPAKPAPKKKVDEVKPSSQEAAWERLNELMANAKEEEKTAQWWAIIAKVVPNKEQNEFTPEEWGLVHAEIDKTTLPY